MTFRKIRNIVSQLTLLTILGGSNLFMLLRRSVGPSDSALEQAIGLSLDPILILCVAIALVLTPIWLGWNFPRIRARLNGSLGVLLLANGATLIGLLLVSTRTTPPPASPSPRPVVKETLRLPVQPAPKTTLVQDSPPPPAPKASLSPSRLSTPTPQVKVAPPPTPSIQEPRENPYSEIDAHALAAPPSVESNISTLARYLVKPAKNDRERIRAIHRWVADRIAYDTLSFFQGDYPDQSAENTLRTRLSVCAGYANLVHALAQKSSVETVVISGYARDADSNGEKTEGDAHAWNAVNLDGRWHLMDATWAAGSVSQARGFQKEYNDFYFLTEPRAFLNSHWPEQDKWQLRESAISWEDFQNQPLLHSEFYSAGLSLPPGTTKELKVAPVGVLEIEVPQDILLKASLQDEAGLTRKGAVRILRQAARATVSVKAPKAGNYKLSLYAGSAHSSRFEGVASFIVSASRGGLDGYPDLSLSLQKVGGTVSAPTEGVVAPGPQQFDLVVPGATTVFVDTWEQALERDGDHFTGQVVLRVGESKVYAQFDEKNAEQVASYRVRYKANTSPARPRS